MAFKLFLDVNIIIDFCDKNREKHNEALEIFKRIENNDLECCVSESVLNTTSYIAGKIIGKTQALLLLNDIISVCRLLPNNKTLYISALHAAKNDIEDSVLYQLALYHQMDFFVTNDIKDFRKIEVPILPVMQAKDILKLI